MSNVCSNVQGGLEEKQLGSVLQITPVEERPACIDPQLLLQHDESADVRQSLMGIESAGEHLEAPGFESSEVSAGRR